MKLATYLRWMGRESRGSRGRMLYFVACLAIGVAAVGGAAQQALPELFGGVLPVDVDPRIGEVDDVLPGAQCGACGQPGCSAYAEAVVTGGSGVSTHRLTYAQLDRRANQVANHLASLGIDTMSLTPDSLPGVARLLARIEADRPANVRIFADDVRPFLADLPAALIEWDGFSRSAPRHLRRQVHPRVKPLQINPINIQANESPG